MLTGMNTTRPPALDELKAGQQWVCFDNEKVPYTPATGIPAKANDPGTWGSYEQAVAAWKSNPQKYAGIGREFIREQKITGIDLDHCIDEQGQVSEWAQAELNRLNSYTEKSPSGHGLHIWVFGIIPSNIAPCKPKPDGYEMYDCKRYFTFTGNHLAGTPAAIEDRQAQLLDLHQEVTAKRAQAKRQSDAQKVTTRPASISRSLAGDTPYGLRALEQECADLRQTGDGARNDQLNTSAFRIGQLVAGGELARTTAEAQLSDAAAVIGLDDREIEKTMRSGLDSGEREPRSAPAKGDSSDKGQPGEQPPTNEPEQQKESVATRLGWIVKEAHFIKTRGGEIYARVPVNGHHEIVSVNEHGSGFRRWLIYRFKKLYWSAPNSDALSLVMAGVSADAEYEGEVAAVYTRMAEKNGRIYLDLCNDHWQCVEIDKEGWRVIDCPPVYFRRPSGMLPLPIPQTGGSLDELRQLIQAKTDRDFVLIASWLIGTLHPTGPYPVLNLNGERGSTKSYTTRVLRNLIDPNDAPTRNAPKDERDAAVAAQNNMVIALDNLSSMPLMLSDVLCRISTGSGFATREMYSDANERVFSAKRPIIINGIEDGIITQGDLLNRAMLVTLDAPTRYIAEEELNEQFTRLHPRILGALLSVVSVALANRKSVQLEKPPRMADFARWITAAEPALRWEAGTFIAAFTENQDNASSIIIESSPLAKAILQFMSDQAGDWSGQTSELHEQLKKYTTYTEAKRAPKDAARLGGQLKRIAASLRIQGIDIQQASRTKRGSFVVIKNSSGVGNDLAGVGGVGNDLAGVGKNLLPTPVLTPDLWPNGGEKLATGVGGVGKSPQLSALLSSALNQKIKEEEEETGRIADNLGKIPTPLTPQAHSDGFPSGMNSGVGKNLLPTLPTPGPAQLLLAEISSRGCHLRLDSGTWVIGCNEDEYEELFARVIALDAELREALK